MPRLVDLGWNAAAAGNQELTDQLRLTPWPPQMASTSRMWGFPLRPPKHFVACTEP